MPKNRDGLNIRTGDWVEVCEPHSAPWLNDEHVELLSRIGQVVTVGIHSSDIEFSIGTSTLMGIVPNDKLAWADPPPVKDEVHAPASFISKYLNSWHDLQNQLAREKPDILSGEPIRLNTRLDIKRTYRNNNAGYNLVCRIRVWAMEGNLMEEEISMVIEAVAALRDEADSIMHGLQIEIANNGLEISNVIDPTI